VRYLALLLAFLTAASAAEERAPRVVPRVILAVYDSHYQRDVRDTRIHRLLEMPLNHLGLVVRYQDRNQGLPAPEQMRDVRGILTWFQSDAMERPAEFLSWAAAAIDAGKRFVVIGDLSVARDLQGQATQTALINRFLAKLGLRVEDWVPVTYNVRIAYKDPAMMDFERQLPAVLPPFDRVRPIDSRVNVHLLARRGGDHRTDSALVVTGPHGGYAASGYTHFASYSQDQLQWYLNPFEFLRLAFATDGLPKPDTTTLAGRRIYYSHIDGDGWRNQTEVPRYRAERISAPEVILRDAIRPFPDLPVTVGPIAADLDPRWFGSRESMRVAREMLAVPWVEAGSHTYSHPLDWESLAQANKENAAVAQRGGLMRWNHIWRPWWERVAERWSKPEAEDGAPSLRRGHSRLRSYELYPYDPNQEIGGSIDFINRILPQGKRVKLLQWSGTTLESEGILEATQKARVRNINGGDTRFDPEFDSYAWVAPLGRQVGRCRQVYSSDSNENTYTNLWNERYFGFRYLVQTLCRTESPIRVKPFNLYYHIFSGEKQASLDAVLHNLAFARGQELAPITASDYAAIVDGFFSAVLTQLGTRCWRVANRDGLNTLRFDHPSEQGVDWARSTGVIGERRYQGSLYVALDPALPVAVVALSGAPFPAAHCRPYLVQSRWQISNLQLGQRSFSFEARGFGRGDMEWQARSDTHFIVQFSMEGKPAREIQVSSGTKGRLRLSIDETLPQPVHVTVRELVPFQLVSPNFSPPHGAAGPHRGWRRRPPRIVGTALGGGS
jgi:polysaccharide biosynthesis protein PelA